MTEEEMYTIKDIKKLSLLEDTKVDLIDKNIDASDEIAGVVLLPHGMKADSKPFNDNFIYLNARMDTVINNQLACKNAIEEYKTDVISAKNSLEDYVDNSVYTVRTIVGENPNITTGTYTFSQEYGYDVPSGNYGVYYYKYDCDDQYASDVFYVLVGRGDNKTNIIPYQACNGFWIKKTYKGCEFDVSDYIDVECGGYININVARIYGNSDYYPDAVKSFTIILPTYLHEHNFTANVIISPVGLNNSHYTVSNEYVAGTTSPLTFRDAGYYYDTHNAQYPMITVTIPKTTSAYNCTLHWSAKSFNNAATYYAHVSNGNLTGIDTYESSNISIRDIVVTKAMYKNYKAFGSNYYIYQDGQIIVNPDYEGES